MFMAVGAGSNDFSRKIFLRPTLCAEKKFFAAHSVRREKFMMPTLIDLARNKHLYNDLLKIERFKFLGGGFFFFDVHSWLLHFSVPTLCL